MGITSSYSRMFTGRSLDIAEDLFVLRITTVRKPRTDGHRFLSTLTVDTASSYGTLISWHGDKLALIGLDDPVITVSFFDEISLNSDKRRNDNRECIAYKSFVRNTTLDFLFTHLASFRNSP